MSALAASHDVDKGGRVGELMPRRPQVPARGRADATPTAFGSSRAVEDVEWAGVVLRFDDLPGLGAHHRAAGVVAEAVMSDQLVRRSGTPSRSFRLRVAFRAWPDRIVVVRLEQPLVPQPDGRLRVGGPYRTVEITEYRAREHSVRRVGDVPVDRAGGSGSGTVSSGLGCDRASEYASQQVAFLPSQVRRSLYARAPRPTSFIAEALKFADRGHYTVQALRMDDREAVVMRASLQVGADSWQVEQLTFVMGESAAISHRPLKQLPR